MDQTTQRELIRRIHGLARAKTTEMGPEEALLPVEPYFSQERFERERALLRNVPVVVAASAQLPEPGDYLTHDEAGAPLLVVRTREGGLAAFLNVCRHRGTRLVHEPQGRRKHAFVCPYHAWTYGEDGRLRNVPHEVGFPSKPTETVGLARVPVTERFGLIWALPRPEPSYDFDAFLAPLAELVGWKLDTLVPYRPDMVRRALNWKLGIEIFLEAYHVRYAHHASIAPMFPDNLLLVDRLGPLHQRVVFPKRTVAELEGTAPESWELREHANILYFGFPGMLMLVQPDFVSLLNVFPGRTPDETVMRTVHLLPELPRDERSARFWNKNVDILLNAVEEDFVMAATIQAGARSGANTHVRLGRYEHALGYFRSALEALLAER